MPRFKEYVKVENNTHTIVPRPQYFLDDGLMTPVPDDWLIENENIYPVVEDVVDGVYDELIPKDINDWIVKDDHILKTFWKIKFPEYNKFYQDIIVKDEPEWVYDGDNVSIHEVTDKGIHFLKVMLKTKVADIRYAYETGGLDISGQRIHTDRESQTKILGAFVLSQMPDAKSRKWKTQNGFITLNPQQLIDIGVAVQDFVQQCYDRENKILVLIEQASTNEELESINNELCVGWPENSLYVGS